MAPRDCKSRYILGIILILSMVASCSGIPILKVNYRMPLVRPDGIREKSVFLAVEDERQTKGFLGPAAASEFEPVSGDLSFSLTKDNEDAVTIGIYDPRSLFMEAFKRRCEELGVQVASERKPGLIVLVIALKEFSLNLVDRKWKAKISYEVRVEKDGRVLYRYDFQGEGERLKLVGTSQADLLMSEIFSDVLNRFDLKKVFSERIQ